MSDAVRQPRPLWLLTLVGTSLLSASILFAVGPAARPEPASAATTTKAAVCNVNLRSKATTSSRLRTVLRSGARVSVTAKVTGGAWRTRCAGRVVAGRTWYRISAINGRAVKALYGTTYVYAASSMFKAAPASPAPTPATTAPTPAPVPPAPGVTTASVRVSSVAGLMAALANAANTDIVVANGTYHISPASSHASDSLYIGSRFAGRTRPVTVRAETIGGVTFDGGGGTSYMGMAFEQGAHDQTWDGFNFANMVGTPIEFGGFTPSAPAHHITLRHITLKSTCLRASASSNQEQGIYFSNAAGSGPHDILLEDVTVDGTNPNSVWSAIHAYHGDPADPPASRVTIRRLTVTGTTNGIVLWNDTAIQHDWLIEDSTISGARDTAIRFESIGAQNIVFDAITSSGSGTRGFYSSMGSNPPGVTFVDDSLH